MNCTHAFAAAEPRVLLDDRDRIGGDHVLPVWDLHAG